jgi:hypothetical protein
MKAIVGVRGLLGAAEKVNEVMRFCSAACMNAYQRRLSPDTQQKIYEINDYRPSWKVAT